MQGKEKEFEKYIEYGNNKTPTSWQLYNRITCTESIKYLSKNIYYNRESITKNTITDRLKMKLKIELKSKKNTEFQLAQ